MPVWFAFDRRLLLRIVAGLAGDCLCLPLEGPEFSRRIEFAPALLDARRLSKLVERDAS